MSKHVNLKDYLGMYILVPKQSTLVLREKKNNGVDVFNVEILTSCFARTSTIDGKREDMPISFFIEFKTEDEAISFIKKFEEE